MRNLILITFLFLISCEQKNDPVGEWQGEINMFKSKLIFKPDNTAILFSGEGEKQRQQELMWEYNGDKLHWWEPDSDRKATAIFEHPDKLKIIAKNGVEIGLLLRIKN